MAVDLDTLEPYLCADIGREVRARTISLVGECQDLVVVAVVMV